MLSAQAFLFSGVLALSLHAHPQLVVLFDGLDKRIAAQPDAYDLRSRRAWLHIDHGTPDSAQRDIKVLMTRKEWKGDALFLEGWRRLLAGQPRQARARIRESIKIKPDAERYRILAKVELALKKPDSAMAAAEKALKLGGGDEDQFMVIQVHQSKGRIPKEAWQRAMEEYPGHPAIMDALFSFCLEAGKGPSVKNCDELTAEACAAWWPESVDWRINRARFLLAAGRAKEMKPVLSEALEKLDDSRAGAQGAQGGQAVAMRKEIFDLMKAAKAAP